MRDHVSIEKAMQLVNAKFPFPDYINMRSGAYHDITKTLLRWMPPPAKILDFGAGPCDKTAMLSALGYQCTAYDDLQDEWHLENGNRQKILKFARDFSIEYVLGEDLDNLPFTEGEFDCVLMYDVLEHLHSSPQKLMQTLLGFLRGRGFLFVTVPNAVGLHKRIRVILGRTNLPDFASFYWYPGTWRGHVREYTSGDLRALCKYLDLDILEIRGSHHSLHAIPRYLKPVWLVITALLRGGRDSWSLVARKREPWTPVNLSRDQIDQILGLYTPYRRNHPAPIGCRKPSHTTQTPFG